MSDKISLQGILRVAGANIAKISRHTRFFQCGLADPSLCPSKNQLHVESLPHIALLHRMLSSNGQALIIFKTALKFCLSL